MADGAEAGRVIAFGPAGQALVRRIGGDGALVLFDLLAHGRVAAGAVVVTTGYRAIARRVGLSKDTVGRQIGALARYGVVKRLASVENKDGFPTPTYELRLADVGIEVSDSAPSWTAS
jgi:DNA-binding Lrp family transcriptional regulator